MFQQLFTSLLLLLSIFAPLISALPTSSLEGDRTLVPRGTNGISTFFYQLGGKGKCGNYNSDSANIVALSPEHFNGANPCGKTIKVYVRAGPGAGRSVNVIVADQCMGCEYNHLDLAVGPWSYLANGHMDMGVLNIAWAWK